MEKAKNYEELTYESLDIPAFEGSLKAEVHIHYGLITLQKMLRHDNPEIGFLQYAAQVNHMETIARASGDLDEEYIESIKEFKKNAKNENLPEYVKEFKLAQFKLQKILEAFFSNVAVKTSGKA